MHPVLRFLTLINGWLKGRKMYLIITKLVDFVWDEIIDAVQVLEQ